MNTVTPDPNVYQMDDALRAFGSEDVVKEALRAFLDISDAMALELREAHLSGHQEKLKAKVHWIKGGLSYIHARQLKVVCLELDRQVQQQPMQDVRQAVEQVCAELARVNRCAESYLES